MLVNCILLFVCRSEILEAALGALGELVVRHEIAAAAHGSFAAYLLGRRLLFHIAGKTETALSNGTPASLAFVRFLHEL